MDSSLLRPFLPHGFDGDIDALWSAYQGGTPDPNPHGFVTWLYHEGHLEGRDARAVLTSGRMVLTLSGQTNSAVLRGEVPGHEPLGVIGRGAMGEVLVVRDRALRRTVALKRTLAGSDADEQDRALFLNEAQITAQLDHPGIVPVYGFEGDGEGAMSYTMKLVHGRTLEKVLDETRQQVLKNGEADESHSLDARLELFLDICDAVAYAHEHGVVHRDLKPENIMVASFNEVLVMDWGIARAVPPERGAEPLRVVGTPAYMSPEQAFGAPMALEPASDQYTLGLILAELVSLKFANPGKVPVECIVRAREGAVRRLEAVAGQGEAPWELQAIVDRATARKPGGRYPSVADLASDVRRYLRDEETSVAPDVGVQKVQRWVSHHRERATAIGFGLVLLMVLLGLGLSALGEARVASQKRASALREAALGRLAGISGRQVQHMDAKFHQWEGLLSGVAFAAELSLTRPAEPDPPYFGVPGDKTTADQAPSRYYDVEVSLESIDFEIAHGVERARVEEQLAQLKRLTPTLRSALVRGSSLDAYKDQAPWLARVREHGLQLVWVYVATEAGVIANYPGTDGAYPEGYDHREMTWYTAAVGETGPVWNMLEADESGMGLLLTASQALYSQSGTFLGVACVDVGFLYLINELLDSDELAAHSEAFLLDDTEMVVARSTHKEAARTMTEFVPAAFEHADLVPEARVNDTGGWVEFEADGVHQLLHWSRLRAVDWTYVIVGPKDELMKVAAEL